MRWLDWSYYMVGFFPHRDRRYQSTDGVLYNNTIIHQYNRTKILTIICHQAIDIASEKQLLL